MEVAAKMITGDEDCCLVLPAIPRHHCRLRLPCFEVIHCYIHHHSIACDRQYLVAATAVAAAAAAAAAGCAVFYPWAAPDCKPLPSIFVPREGRIG